MSLFSVAERLAAIERSQVVFDSNHYVKNYFGSLTDELKAELDVPDELKEINEELKKSL